MAGLLAFTHAGYVAAGWTITVLLIAGYALVTVGRGRRMSRKVPPGERRWS